MMHRPFGSADVYQDEENGRNGIGGMAGELELTLQNTESPVRRTLKITDESIFRMLQGSIQALFATDSASLHEFEVTLKLKKEKRQPDFFEGELPLEAGRRGLADSGRVVHYDETGEPYYVDYHDFDDYDDYDQPFRFHPPKIDENAKYKALIEEARKVASAKPWEVLEEGQVFICEVHRSEEPLFVSVLGHDGNELGLSISRGWDGFRQLLRHLDGTGECNGQPSPPGLRVTFENREELPEDDQLFFRNLNSYFIGKRWPRFRVHEPDSEPRRPGADEVGLFANVLSCVRSVASKARKGFRIPVPAQDQEIAAIKGWRIESGYRTVPEFPETEEQMRTDFDTDWEAAD